MSYKAALAAVLLAAASTSANAQAFSGDLGFNYATPTGTGEKTVTEYFGGIEYAVNRNFSLAFGLKSVGIEDIDSSFTNGTLHLIYHYDDTVSLGVFSAGDVVGTETAAGVLAASRNTLGVEAGGEFGEFSGEGYIGYSAKEGTASATTMVGLEGYYDIADNWAATGSFHRLSSDNSTSTKLAIGVEYAIANGPDLYGKIGQRSATAGSTSGDSQYIEIGASVSFGASRGTTFDTRSIFETLPNF